MCTICCCFHTAIHNRENRLSYMALAKSVWWLQLHKCSELFSCMLQTPWQLVKGQISVGWTLRCAPLLYSYSCKFWLFHALIIWCKLSIIINWLIESMSLTALKQFVLRPACFLVLRISICEIEYSLAWKLGTIYSAITLYFQRICLISTFCSDDAWFIYSHCYSTLFQQSKTMASTCLIQTAVKHLHS